MPGEAVPLERQRPAPVERVATMHSRVHYWVQPDETLADEQARAEVLARGPGPRLEAPELQARERTPQAVLPRVAGFGRYCRSRSPSSLPRMQN